MTLNKQDEIIHISKMFDLQEGESVTDLVRKIQKALYTHLERHPHYWDTFGIYMEHVVICEWSTGDYYQIPYSREGDHIMFGDMVQVKIQFVPVESVQMSQNETTTKVKRSQLQEHLFSNII